MYKVTPKKRYTRTLAFIKESMPADAKILDLGVNNPFSEIMREQGWEVSNTEGEDLDLDQHNLVEKDYNVLTAFEILEHTLNPLTILRACRADRIYLSIPMRYWFKSAYKSDKDPWDRHYHEFEDWQFDWLVEKAGFEIIRRDKWKSGGKWIGFRPVLRNFYNRYYIIEAVRKEA